MKALSVFAAGTIVFLLAFCSTAKKAPNTFEPSAEQLQAAMKRWSNANATELKEGHQLFYGECKECHKPYKIAEFSEKKWLHEIDDMSPKAKLTDQQKEKLTRFILSMRDISVRAKVN
jgi:hypothetical protein